jgi:hypothetical protein
MTVVASRNGYVGDDPARLDLDVVHGYLRTAYWSPGVPRDVVERSIENSVASLHDADPGRYLVRQVPAGVLYAGPR